MLLRYWMLTSELSVSVHLQCSISVQWSQLQKFVSQVLQSHMRSPRDFQPLSKVPLSIFFSFDLWVSPIGKSWGKAWTSWRKSEGYHTYACICFSMWHLLLVEWVKVSSTTVTGKWTKEAYREQGNYEHIDQISLLSHTYAHFRIIKGKDRFSALKGIESLYPVCLCYIVIFLLRVTWLSQKSLIDNFNIVWALYWDQVV